MSADLRSVAARGIALCRQDRWREGIELLGWVSQKEKGGTELPSQFYAYLGYGLARREHRVGEGLQLCEHAVKLGFYEPENYLMLAQTAILARSRGRAASAVERGLKIDPAHRGLRRLQRKMGRRRRPLLGFLDRGHLLNRALGRLRHTLMSKRD